MPGKKIKNKFCYEERRLKFSYPEFIKSEWWTKQKQDWYSRHKKRCAKCKCEVGIHLHHKRYPKDRRFLRLDDNAFVALCANCHFIYHKMYGVQQYMQTTSNKFVKVGKLL